jgi:hypothetical protein
VIEPGGPFYDIARHTPFAALLSVHDRIWNDRVNFNEDERQHSCGIIRGILAGFAFRVNEKFRRVAKG